MATLLVRANHVGIAHRLSTIVAPTHPVEGGARSSTRGPSLLMEARGAYYRMVLRQMEYSSESAGELLH